MELGRVGTRLARHLAGIPHTDGYKGKALLWVWRGGEQPLPRRGSCKNTVQGIVREGVKKLQPFMALVTDTQLELLLGESGWAMAASQAG